MQTKLLNRILIMLVTASLMGNEISHAQTIYETSWSKDGALMGGGLVLLGAGLYAKSTVKPFDRSDLAKLNPQDVLAFDRPVINNWSPRANKASDWLRDACLLSPLSLLAAERTRDNAGRYLLIYAETLSLASGASMVVKGLVKRTRPFVYHPDRPESLKMKSNARQAFYSGHATMAFTGAVFFARSYQDLFPGSDWRGVVWGGSLAAAGMVGALRVIAGKHYYTDVIVGGVIGAAIGYLIPELHERKPNKNSEETPFMLSFRMPL